MRGKACEEGVQAMSQSQYELGRWMRRVKTVRKDHPCQGCGKTIRKGDSADVWFEKVQRRSGEIGYESYYVHPGEWK